jgi:hypothetical protein
MPMIAMPRKMSMASIRVEAEIGASVGTSPVERGISAGDSLVCSVILVTRDFGCSCGLPQTVYSNTAQRAANAVPYLFASIVRDARRN